MRAANGWRWRSAAKGTSGQWSSRRGEVVSGLTKLGTTDQTGTKILFKPDPQIFPNTTFAYDTIHKRLQDCAFLNAGVKVHIKDERTGQSDSFHYEDGLSEFVKYLNRTETPLTPEVIRISRGRS